MREIILSVLLLAGSAMAVEMGKVPSSVSLSGENGGKVDGSVWSSKMLKGKVHIVFYVDPDKREENEALTKALKKRHFDRSKYASVAIINLAATWLPNAILESKLKTKQKEFPDTIYVKDKKKVLVLSPKEIKSVLALIEKNL